MNDISDFMRRHIRELWRYGKKTSFYKPGRGPSLDTEFADTLMLDFPFSRIVKNTFLLLKPSNVWWFVIAVWAKTLRVEVAGCIVWVWDTKVKNQWTMTWKCRFMVIWRKAALLPEIGQCTDLIRIICAYVNMHTHTDTKSLRKTLFPLWRNHLSKSWVS